MSIKINFDTAHNPEAPTIILAKKNGDKLGQIDAKSIEVTDSLNDAAEISFKVYKEIDGAKCNLWELITDFKLVYCVEWNMWFEIAVELDESTEITKTVSCIGLGQAELSQIMLYDIEINTEEDIARDEYVVPTVIYNRDNPGSSLLHRVMGKAPHYSVVHVDNSVAKMQRMFSFDDNSIYDTFQEISEEINCLFVLHSNSNAQGVIQRTISVYDLEANCIACGHRSEFTDVCPECGSHDISEGYGSDTMIFVTADDVAEDIQLSTDTDSVKNCFKLEAGDDLMTASVRNCNPNGSDYIWYISDGVKADMSERLVEKIAAYDMSYAYYQKDHIALASGHAAITRYNALVAKYKAYNKDLESISAPIKGYPALMNAYYNTIDLELYLQSALMPTVTMSDTSAVKESAKLTVANLSPVSAESIKTISVATADNIVMSMAKVIIDSTRYKIKVASSSISGKTDTRCAWTGSFVLTNYSDEEDTATSAVITIEINNNYELFVKQKIEKSLSKGDTDDMSISGLFKKTQADFVKEIKKYSLNRLTSFYDACQTCIDILIEQGIADDETWSGKDPNLYNDLYKPYLQKLSALAAETKVRQDEIYLIAGAYDADGTLKTYGLQNYLEDEKSKIQKALDFETYLGSALWLEFCTFRREDKYSNENYISDGLNNADLFKKSLEFVDVANKEIYKSAELQHSISASLKNLLVMKKFESLVDGFQVGNWIRVMIDEEVYRLRMISYSIDYDSMEDISVEFSDVVRSKDSVSDVKGILSQASSMATSYDSVKRQAKQGNESNSQLNNWASNGLALTNMKIVDSAENQNVTWDSHGILCREYRDESDAYDDRQLKIINRGLYVTNDNWKTSKAGIGSFKYYNPKLDAVTDGYGVIADTIVGRLMLSEAVGVYTDDGNVTIDNNGITITATTDDKNVFLIKGKTGANGEPGEKIVYINSSGNLVLEKGRVIFGNLGGDDMGLDELTSIAISASRAAEEAVKTANAIDGKASSALTKSGEAIASASDASSKATASAKTATDYLTTDGNGHVLIKGKQYNSGGTATMASGASYDVPSSVDLVPLTAITQYGSNLSVSGNGVKASYAGAYEVSGCVSVEELTTGKDVRLQIVKGSTVIQDCTSTSSGTNQTITISPIVTTLTAGQIAYLKVSSTGGGKIVGNISAALTVKLLG